ncbi:Aste57867_8967 [Aphanomyces stellatus]|uniref:Aste57867_8967 protein n=1 Tax=Aphanomyces stellatus TaxID=120398 RepID=A0A485KLU7_9STRA|nr:hypothetical protein As57867_008932 [Aphanomyces stellatus]VFT85851.1 Aste57867_8967 [Aphanomyces stellatus]
MVDANAIAPKRGRGRPRKDVASAMTGPVKRANAASVVTLDLTEDVDDAPLKRPKGKGKRVAATVDLTTSPLDLSHEDNQNAAPLKRPRARAKGKKAAVVDLTAPSVPDHINTMLAKGGIQSLGSYGLGNHAASSEAVDEADAIDVDATQAVEDVFFGAIKNKIVGIQHYRGRVGRREAVSLVREPRNPYDRNAIAVHNLAGEMVGHVPRELAAVCAPLLDTGLMTVEGICPSPPGTYTMPIQLLVYGQENNRERIMGELSPYGLATSGPALAGLAKAGKGTSRFSLDDKVLHDSLFAGEVDVAQLPPLPSAALPSSLRATLLHHQLQALQWIVQRENPTLVTDGPPVQLWRSIKDYAGKPYFVNEATRTEQAMAPVLCRGGILADDMGLGKTLTLLTHIASDKKPTPTLIICPLSVIQNWVQQASDHFDADALHVFVHHNNTRLKKASDAAAFDVVVTTYGTLALEAQHEGVLRSTAWRRVVLDEGHLIKSKSTNMFKAAALLNADCRWVLSGTPITNKIDDLAALLTFLRYKPFDDGYWWTRAIGRPLRREEPEGIRIVKALMKDVALRRTKGKSDRLLMVTLPLCTVYSYPIELRPDEREQYNRLEDAAKANIQRLLDTNTFEKQYALVLEMMMRLRQTCNHTSLCPPHYLAKLQAKATAEVSVVDYSTESVQQLVDILREACDSGEECAICMDPLKDAVITMCRHFYCRPCISCALETKPNCPLCRQVISAAELVTDKQAPVGPTDNLLVTNVVPSSKMEALVHLLGASPKHVKSVVFSQWTSMLALTKQALDARGIPSIVYDGSMTRATRDQNLKTFKETDTAPVLLMSLKCGSMGLNITEASQVFLLDPWWNTAIENQAIDRVFRLGQTHPVQVFKFVVQNSIEERVVTIQKEKFTLIKQAFGGIKGASDSNVKEKRLDIAAVFQLHRATT